MYSSINHTCWECKYHVVFIPKYRKKAIYSQIRKSLGKVFKELARQKECLVEEGHLCSDHIHMLLSVPPKYSVSQVIGYMKGKRAIYISRNFYGRNCNYVGYKFWARGYFVSTVGRNESVIREYIKNQEIEDKKLDQLELFKNNP